jgi:hypothetical protein
VGTVLALRLFPVAIRFTALAVSFNVGITLFGSTAPYVSTWLVARSGPIAPAVYLAAASVTALLAVTLGTSKSSVGPSGSPEAGGGAGSCAAVQDGAVTLPRTPARPGAAGDVAAGQLTEGRNG